VGAPQETAPVVLGLQRPEPLDQASVGELLISELGCVACHASECGERQARKIAPDLTQVGGRVAPEYLRSFIADPGGAHPGTTMPNLLDEQEPARRA
jgi:cytochrome c2